MKIIKSFAIIFGIWILGELVGTLIKGIIVIPGSIIGMVILFILLNTKLIKLDMIREVSDFFLTHITLFVTPLGISLVGYFDIIKQNIMPMILTGVVVTIVSIMLTILFVEFLLRLTKPKGGEQNE